MRRLSDKAVKQKFGDAVRAARHDLGISQEELAHRARIHRTYISDVERGARNPGLVNIWRIAGALKVKASELMGEVGL